MGTSIASYNVAESHSSFSKSQRQTYKKGVFQKLIVLDSTVTVYRCLNKYYFNLTIVSLLKLKTFYNNFTEL